MVFVANKDKYLMDKFVKPNVPKDYLHIDH